MNVVLVHYHLRMGGVTNVLIMAARALEQRGIVPIVLCGEEPEASIRAQFSRVIVYEGLGYAADAADWWHGATGAVLLKEIQAMLKDAGWGEIDLWHIHNHSLGKGPGLIRLVAALAEVGAPMVLQLHDFAEDGRPENWRRIREGLDAESVERMYPQGKSVVYAVLNGRDAHCLRAAGGERCVMLPNAVDDVKVPGDARNMKGTTPFWIYPTRAIRRKNLGEYLLWAALESGDTRYVVTRAPKNPAEQQRYARWKSIAERYRLPVDFEVGETSGRSLGELLQGSKGVVTTSIAEGFGLAFLEPWLAGKAVYGRKLPEITALMEADGLQLDHLYKRLDVPLEWIGIATLRDRVAEASQQVYRQYGWGRPDVDGILQGMIQGDCVDFGRLDEAMQETVLAHVVRGGGNDISGIEPATFLWDQAIGPRVDANGTVVRERYNTQQYGRRLEALYRGVLEHSGGAVNDWVDPVELLRQFMNPARFSLLRS